MKFLIVDDHSLVRDGLRGVLQSIDETALVLEAESADQAYQLLADHADVELMLLDVSLPGTDGLAVLEALRLRRCMVPVVALSGIDDRRTIMGMLDRGASGFIPKSSSRKIIVHAIRLVLDGGTYLPSQMLDAPVRGDVGHGNEPKVLLTGRQRQVIACLAQGKPNKLIACELNVTEATVKAHITDIMRTLKVTNRTQAVIAARNLGIGAAGPVNPA
jgi:DNA-binding NarL/FixJ family response regulator